jgi:hypothetical protein
VSELYPCKEVKTHFRLTSDNTNHSFMKVTKVSIFLSRIWIAMYCPLSIVG